MASEQKPSKSQELIEQNLKRVFQESVDEELPDRFKDLLARLKSSEGQDGTPK